MVLLSQPFNHVSTPVRCHEVGHCTHYAEEKVMGGEIGPSANDPKKKKNDVTKPFMLDVTSVAFAF